jgi:hypothetical protein
MNAIVILLMLSPATGFALGISFTWRAILISSATIAVISAAVLHNAGFGALPGIAMIVACLTVHQLAYLIGAVSSGLSENRKTGERRTKAFGAWGRPKLH